MLQGSILRKVADFLIEIRDRYARRHWRNLCSRIEMPTIQKSDLQFSDYSWSAIKGDDPRLTGKPDDVLLNRREGYEILSFLTNFTSTRKDVNGNPLTKVHAHQAERLIRNHLPGEIRSRKDVAQWLIDNWSKY